MAYMVGYEPYESGYLWYPGAHRIEKARDVIFVGINGINSIIPSYSMVAKGTG
jgi:hypothetical protein